MTGAAYEFDIIVITHGNQELSMRCVKTIYEHTTSPFHLIVMDDSTPDMDEGTDMTPDWFARFQKAHDNLTFIHSDVPYKSSIQVFKQAYEYCKTPYVAIVVNSILVEPEWSTAALQLFRVNPQIGIVAFKSVRAGTELIECAGLASSSDGSTIWDIGRGQASHRLSKVYECDAAQFAFVMLRLDAVKNNPGEDIYYGFRGWEDFETCFSVREKGWKIFYCGLGVGYHHTLATRLAKSSDELIENIKNREIFAKRWGFWPKYHEINRQLGEFFPDMEVRAKLSPVMIINPVGEIHQELDLKERIVPKEEEAISSLACKVQRNATFVEVGSWKGHSASIIGKVAKQSEGHLYCVDHWKGNDGTWNVQEAQGKDIYKIFEYNLRTLGLWDCITPMKMDSVEASKKFADASIDFLFLDADHRYKQFKEDLEAWLPKIKSGGIICGHDCEGYYSKVDSRDRELIDSHLTEDYIEDPVCHPGVVKGLYDCFHDDYSIIEDTRIWVKEKE